ncbi:DUF4423 domain-containing protein [Bdellovibrio sp. HCB337]|uniref:DUF4423 domain-containing protein n=1 Tax=Bdellovibrio sp. HCB337 TaxID=3394358 RepID=UPI0039A6159E
MSIAVIIKSEFEKRKTKNKRYSLRSFAKSLGMDPTSVSRIMREERFPSSTTCQKILRTLKISSVSVETSRAKRTSLLQNAFEEKVFENLFHSKHIYLLTALRLNTLTSEQIREKFCRMFEINEEEYLCLVDDLKNAGALVEKGPDLEVVFKNKSTVPLPFTSVKRKSMQKEFLHRAADAIEKVSFEDRDNATLTLAFNKKDLPQVKRILQNARMKINRLSEKRRVRDAVYNVSTAVYPILSAE